MEVIKQQMAKDEGPPVAPHAPAHGIIQPNSLISTAPQMNMNNNNVLNNNSIDIRKGPRPNSGGILRHPNLAAPS
jgi:hypothetical protein